MVLFLSSKKKMDDFYLLKIVCHTLLAKKKSTTISARLLFLIEHRVLTNNIKKEASKGNLHVELSIKLVHEDIRLTFD